MPVDEEESQLFLRAPPVFLLDLHQINGVKLLNSGYCGLQKCSSTSITALMFSFNVCGLQPRDAALGISAPLQKLDLLSLEMQLCLRMAGSAQFIASIQ